MSENAGLGKLTLAKRRVLADEVTDGLRDAIVSHELESGSKLAEDELAAQMGVSRGPIREALMRLEREGLITIERHRGARVSLWTRQDIEEIYALRGALEKLAITWACKNATASDIAEMEEVIKEFQKLSDKSRTPKVVSRLDLDFHTSLFKAAHHERLFASWEVLRSQMNALLFYTWARDIAENENARPRWASDHQELVNIIKKKNAAGSSAVVNSHVDGGFARIEKHFPEPSRPIKKSKKLN